jgi:hypothetical protein
MQDKDILDTIFRLNRELYEKSIPGPPREVGNYLIFATDVPNQAPRIECIFDPSTQYVPDGSRDYSWIRHLKL